jgi:hypothetical protein
VTVILQQEMPDGTPMEMLDEVTDEMGVDENPPQGLLVHVHFEKDGRVHVVDVWESPEAFESFRESRLMPAMQAVAERHGMQGEPPEPESSITEVHRAVRGRS